MNKFKLLLILLPLMTSCTTLLAPDWNEFYKAVPGEVVSRNASQESTRTAPQGSFVVFGLPRHMTRGSPGAKAIEQKFADICLKRGGMILEDPSSGEFADFPLAQASWQEEVSVRWNASIESWVVLCGDFQTKETASAVMFYQEGARSTKLALFSERGINLFFDYYLRHAPQNREREASDTRTTAEYLKDYDARKLQEALNTRKLRSTPQLGDQTSMGTIVELRPPLVLIQYRPELRASRNLPAAEWMQISTIEAPLPKQGSR